MAISHMNGEGRGETVCPVCKGVAWFGETGKPECRSCGWPHKLGTVTSDEQLDAWEAYGEQYKLVRRVYATGTYIVFCKWVSGVEQTKNSWWTLLSARIGDPWKMRPLQGMNSIDATALLERMVYKIDGGMV